VINPGSGGTVTTACGAANGTGNLNTTVTMKSGAVIVYTVPATIAPSASGSLANTATVAVPAGVIDSVPANNSSTDTDGVVVIASAIADLSLVKSSDSARVAPGGTVTYTIVVTNNGPDEVIAAGVTDIAPAALTFTSWTCAVTNAGSGGPVASTCGALSGSGSINTSVTMQTGAIITFTVHATVSATASGSITNVASVAVPSGTIDPALANNSGTSAIEVATSAAVVPVPASSKETLFALGLLLALVGVASRRRIGRRVR
jgi:uncharacterized repeat protein (TIGR01451 family)